MLWEKWEFLRPQFRYAHLWRLAERKGMQSTERRFGTGNRRNAERLKLMTIHSVSPEKATSDVKIVAKFEFSIKFYGRKIGAKPSITLWVNCILHYFSDQKYGVPYAYHMASHLIGKSRGDQPILVDLPTGFASSYGCFNANFVTKTKPQDRWGNQVVLFQYTMHEEMKPIKAWLDSITVQLSSFVISQ
uniref:Uncharacterized protein n=1 Tax=Romanomermis culicivorax TaxID=13658 RepID=A0A915HWA1_ROMCU